MKNKMNLFDSSITFYVPRQIRVLIISFLMIGVASSVIVLFYAVDNNHRVSWVLASIGFLELCIISLIGIFLFISIEKSSSKDRIIILSDSLLSQEIPEALKDMDYSKPSYKEFVYGKTPNFDKRKSLARVYVSFLEGGSDAYYNIKTSFGEISMRIEFNIKRFSVLYFVVGEKNEMEKYASPVIDGAKSSGWDYHYEPQNDRNALVFQINKENDFIYSSAEKRFLCQDIAIMSRAMIYCVPEKYRQIIT